MRGRAGHTATTAALGAHLRRERLRRDISLRELARRLDVSPSLISQIETDKIQPSVGTLYAIVRELGLSFDDVFAAAAHADESGAGGESGAQGLARVERSDDRRPIELESGVRWEHLSGTDEHGLDVLYTTYEPGGASSETGALVHHDGHEFGIVLSGRLGVTVGVEEHVLEAGDSISFASTVPHRLHNDGDGDVTAVWVVVGGEQAR